jgi:hypothetical protein
VTDDPEEQEQEAAKGCFLLVVVLVAGQALALLVLGWLIFGGASR